MKPDLVRIKHMLDAATEILDFTSGKTRQDLDNDRKLSLSIVHLLEIIGEAANKVSPEFRQKYHKIPWKSVVATRNRLIHGYYDLDMDIVWQTVVTDLSPLVKKLNNIIELEE